MGSLFFGMIEKIEFSFFGLDLLEPMAFISNGLVALVCLFGYYKAKNSNLSKWKIFFLSFAIASLSGALSHLFWNYWGFFGKIVPWFFGVLSSAFLITAMIDFFSFRNSTRFIFHAAIALKGCIVLLLAYSYWNFLFVAVDTILSLFVACGVGTFILYFHYDRKDLIYMLLGFLVMLPSAAVFLLKLDLHLWLNREDLSHILIAIGLALFVKNLTAVSKSLVIN